MTLRLKPPRVPWTPFPDVVLHASETAVKKHPVYSAAKRGDFQAAARLVSASISEAAIDRLAEIIGTRAPILVSVHAFEADGTNAIPRALAEQLGEYLNIRVENSVFQVNVVNHTGAKGPDRLARQAGFDGTIISGEDYVIVDDFVGQGGTLANLRGFVEFNGGRVIAATTLTGKPFSAKLAVDADQLAALRAKHGEALEIWWNDRFGHTFDCLTQSEARYLEKTSTANTIRDRIVAAEQA